MVPALKSGLGFAKTMFKSFLAHEAPRLAAALAYYTVFALPPLLILLILLAGTIWDPREVERALETQFAGLIGQQAAGQVREIIQRADRPGTGGPLPTLLGIGGLLLGGTGAFVELQSALNRAWNVKPDPERGDVRNFLAKRLISLGMVLAIAFLLLVSLAVSTAIAAVGDRIAATMGGLSDEVLQALNLVVSFAVITVLFAAMYKFLPDAEVAWRDVWTGAMITTGLFTVGKFLIGLYLGRSEPGSAYGAAGSMAVILVWIYYASMIVLLGAEFTRVWAERRGRAIRPEKGAVSTDPDRERAR